MPNHNLEHYAVKEKVIWDFWGGDLNQSEKISESKPPLVMTIFL